MTYTYTELLLTVCIVQFLTIIILLFSQIPGPGHNYFEKYDELDDNNTSTIDHVIATEFSSSVLCVGESKRTRECRFQNICYNAVTDQYLFFHGKQTVIYGLPENRNDPALVDLSSVDDHNGKYFFYTDVLASHYNNFDDIDYIQGKGILFHRFNPENIMHVIHDDLIPLYHTKKKHFPLNDASFIMMDGQDKGPYFDLYNLFSNHILLKPNFTKNLTCFQDLIIGLAKTTTWYQYGFKVPQGPISKSNYPRTELIYFRDEFKMKLTQNASSNGSAGFQNYVDDIDLNDKFIVLFSRSVTRKILNEGHLVFKLSAYFMLPVRVVRLESDNILDIVLLVSKAFIVIGMHGAHLVTSLFMAPFSTLVEIFPFGIPSQYYTPYRTLTELVSVNYMAWENHFEKNTVTYPDGSAEFGGISHLPEMEKQNIMNTKVVPQHLCCKDPFWLFRIYQDTVLDLNKFVSDLNEKLTVLQNLNATLNQDVALMNNILSRHYVFMYPGHVSDIRCNRQKKELRLTWKTPWNMVNETNIKYQLLISLWNKNSHIKVQNLYEVAEAEFVIEIGDNDDLYTVWICGIFYGKKGRLSDKVEC